MKRQHFFVGAREAFIIVFVLVFSYLSIRPFFTAGFFPMHDDTQVGRVVAMGRALLYGQFPVRWVADLGYGYGYPLFNFYGPLPYYIGGFLYALGIPGLTATKMMFVIGIILAGLVMYIATRGILGRSGAVVASIFYLYAPYHAVQVYVRGAVGEFWTLIFFPLIVWAVWRLMDNARDQLAVVVGGGGLAGVILSHTILGYVTTMFLISGIFVVSTIQVLCKTFSIRNIFPYGAFVLLGLGISAFFWLPAVAEMRFTNVAGQVGSTANFRDHFVCLSQLWNSLWGFGGSVAGCVDGLSFKLGKLHIIISLVSLGVILLRPSVYRVNKSIIFLSVTIVAVSLFFMTSVSSFLWEVIPMFSYIQYPWRFLTYAILGVALLAGMVITISRNTMIQWLAAIILVVLCIFFNGKWFVPQYVDNRSFESYESREELRFRVSKISDEYLPPAITSPKDKEGMVRETISPLSGLSIETEVDTDTYTKFILTTESTREISIQRAYFPGWYYLVNGQNVSPRLLGGLPHITLPKGRNVVELYFANTPIRTVANIFSILTIAVLLLIYGKKSIN